MQWLGVGWVVVGGGGWEEGDYFMARSVDIDPILHHISMKIWLGLWPYYKSFNVIIYILKEVINRSTNDTLTRAHAHPCSQPLKQAHTHSHTRT